MSSLVSGRYIDPSDPAGGEALFPPPTPTDDHDTGICTLEGVFLVTMRLWDQTSISPSNLLSLALSSRCTHLVVVYRDSSNG